MFDCTCYVQPNGWMDNWVDFVRERRIGHMLRLINDPGLNQLGDKLLPNLHKFFEGIEVRPPSNSVCIQ